MTRTITPKLDRGKMVPLINQEKLKQPPPARISYRVAEFAKLSGIPYNTVLYYCNLGTIPSVKIGRVRIIPASYVTGLGL
jgi:hypothetical protein